MRKLTVDDITDLRAYERERADFRASVIDLKRDRRIPLGDLMTVVFENLTTMRFQIQEMARAERMLTDEQIAHEVAVYNGLLPDDGQLSATLFLELTSDALLREWLPKLVGLQRHVAFEVAGVVSPAVEIDEDRLTREDDVTSAVHYLRFAFTPEQIAGFAAGPVVLRIDHPEYRAETVLSEASRRSLLADFG